MQSRAKRSARTPRRSINRRSDERSAPVAVNTTGSILPDRRLWFFPLACPVATSRGAVLERIRMGEDLSVCLVTVISLTLGLSLQTAGLGQRAPARANNAAAAETIDLRMGFLS